MNDSASVVNVLTLCLSLLGLVYLFFWRFSKLWIDEFRQNIFEIRDELFDFAADGGISFDHPAYYTLRSMLNGYVRFSHRISALYFVSIVFYTIWRNREVMPHLFADTWTHAESGLDAATKEYLKSLRDRAGAKLFHFLFFSSYLKKFVFFVSIIGPLTLLSVRYAKKKKDTELTAYRYCRSKSRKIRESVEVLDSEAYVCGRERYYAPV